MSPVEPDRPSLNRNWKISQNLTRMRIAFAGIRPGMGGVPAQRRPLPPPRPFNGWSGVQTALEVAVKRTEAATTPRFGDTMADDKTKRAPQDSSRINIREDYEVRYWTEKFGCTKQQLEDAVKKVGTSAEAVETELKRR